VSSSESDTLRGFEQEIRWRTPATSVRWRGKAEIVMTLNTPYGGAESKIDIRTRRTHEHPKGEGFTKEGVRLTLEEAHTLSKAIQHTLSELRETDATG
tara:strand:- start:1517 stop:1810 length:294 start_codon:yes stop_codon:yes gene_type:complete